MQLDKGYKSAYFITNAGTQTYEADGGCYIIVTQDTIRSMQQILPICEKCASEGRGLVIIGNVDQSVADTLVYNKLNGVLKVCVVDAPSYGEKRIKSLEALRQCPFADV